MNKIITLFHGSEKVIEVPSFGEGKRNNDFGLGGIALISVVVAHD